jgi:hypothetical protein
VDFAYSSEQLELRARAAALAAEIMVHEQACEEAGGSLRRCTPRSPTASAIMA